MLSEHSALSRTRLKGLILDGAVTPQKLGVAVTTFNPMPMTLTTGALTAAAPGANPGRRRRERSATCSAPASSALAK